MIAVNGYFDGNKCVALDTSQFHPNQRLVITALDEDYSEQKSEIEARKEKINAMKSFFGTLSHDEAESIRNNRLSL